MAAPPGPRKDGTVKPQALPEFFSSTPDQAISDHHQRLLDLGRLFEQTQRSIPLVIERYVAPHGLSVLAWQALEKVESLGEDSTLSAIGECVMASPSTMTGIAARLEHAGLVIRKTPDGDHRAFVLQLTERGRETVEAVSTQFLDDLKRVVEGIDVEELDAFLRAFQRIVEILQHLLTEPIPTPSGHCGGDGR